MVKWQRDINITNCPHAWGTPSMRARTRRILHTFSDITKNISKIYFNKIKREAKSPFDGFFSPISLKNTIRLSADILIVLADAIKKFSNILIVFSDLLIGQIGRIGLVGGQLYSDLDFKPFSQPQNKKFVYKIKATTSEEVAAQK